MRTVNRTSDLSHTPMRGTPIDKSPGVRVSANMTDYQLSRREFSWEAARFGLAEMPGGGVNLAYEAVDRHLGTGAADAAALRWIGATGSRVALSYAELAALAGRFAMLLRCLGVRRGDHIGIWAGRTPETFIAALGAWKAGCVVVPVRSGLTTDQIQRLLTRSGATTLVTTVDRYSRAIHPHRPELPALRNVLVTDAGIDDALADHILELSLAMAAVSDEFATVRTDFDAPALFYLDDSGAARVCAHGAMLAYRTTAHYALDLRAGDIYWCTADPADPWGMAYGLIAPLSLGVTVVCSETDPDSARCYDILTRERVAVWYLTPKVLHTLMHEGQVPQSANLSRLRFAACASGHLTADEVAWSATVLGHPIHDNWPHPHTGVIMLANFAAESIEPGSAGQPLPGIDAAVLRYEPRGIPHFGSSTIEFIGPGEVGELALRASWPTMFTTGDARPIRTATLADGWEPSGLSAVHDPDGHYWLADGSS